MNEVGLVLWMGAPHGLHDLPLPNYEGAAVAIRHDFGLAAYTASWMPIIIYGVMCKVLFWV